MTLGTFKSVVVAKKQADLQMTVDDILGGVQSDENVSVWARWTPAKVLLQAVLADPRAASLKIQYYATAQKVHFWIGPQEEVEKRITNGSNIKALIVEPEKPKSLAQRYNDDYFRDHVLASANKLKEASGWLSLDQIFEDMKLPEKYRDNRNRKRAGIVLRCEGWERCQKRTSKGPSWGYRWW